MRSEGTEEGSEKADGDGDVDDTRKKLSVAKI
jgi:hypothetical protein